jgi:RNA polymerase sigma factor (sigma-70 family)
MNDEILRISKEQAGKIFENHLKHIKRTIKKRIAIYEPLEFKTAFNGFVKWVQDEEYKVIREIPADCPLESYLDDWVREFLIEKTYFHFLFEEEDLITRFVINISNKNGIPLTLSPEITIFVREKLEDKNKLAAIKRSFKEGSKLKTYFYTMTRHLVFDYGRKYNVKVELKDPIDMEKIESSTAAPHIQLEEKEIKERVEKLGHEEKVVLKMYYYENITNFNLIARTLKTTRHKAKKILENAVDKVLKGKV